MMLLSFLCSYQLTKNNCHRFSFVALKEFVPLGQLLGVEQGHTDVSRSAGHSSATSRVRSPHGPRCLRGVKQWPGPGICEPHEAKSSPDGQAHVDDGRVPWDDRSLLRHAQLRATVCTSAHIVFPSQHACVCVYIYINV